MGPIDNDHDNSEGLDFSSMPNFIPKDAPDVKPSAPAAEEVLSFRKNLGEGNYCESWHLRSFNGPLHREDGPAKILHYSDGSIDQEWFFNGERHREDGPAIIAFDGTEQWFLNGKLQDPLEAQAKAQAAKAAKAANVQESEASPSLEYERSHLGDSVYCEEYRLNGEYHREDGPAVIIHYPDGTMDQTWYRDGKVHREDGPAIIGNDGGEHWFLNGERQPSPQVQQLPEVPDAPEVPESSAALPDVPEVPVLAGESAAVEPHAPAKVEADVSAQAPAATQAADLPPGVMKALMATAAEQNEAAQAAAANPVVAGAPRGAGAAAADSGLKNLADGGLSLVGGLSALAGTVGRGIGSAARNLSSSLEARQSQAAVDEAPPRTAPGISVLPRISEYRIDQAEKMAGAYENAVNEFWASGKLPDVRRAIEAHARETGASVPDVMAKMVPGGELEGLRKEFIEAVSESPEAQGSKKAMDRALDSWLRQYGRGSEELLSPDGGENAEHEAMRSRFEGTREKMEELVGQSPVFAGEEASHAQRFKAAVERIAQRIREVVERVTDFIRGRSASEARQEAGYEP